MKLSGNCLCGVVTVSADEASDKVSACHCKDCQTWAGGPAFVIDCGTKISFKGADQVTVFDSSPWAQRGFCSLCGTHIFFRVKQTQQYYLPAGLFKDNAQFTLDHQIFVDHKPHFYDFSQQTAMFTGDEFFAMVEQQS